MVLIRVSVQWLVHAYGNCVYALDSAWFWEEYQGTGWYMVLRRISVQWIVYGSGRSIIALNNTRFW